MTIRIVGHLPSIEALRRALPDFAGSMQQCVHSVVEKYNLLVDLYNTKMAAVQQKYDAAMQSIDGLRNCNCSDDCSCLSRYESLSARYYSEYMRKVEELQSIMNPVESKMKITPMFSSMERITNDIEPYQDGLGNFIQTAQTYLESER
jgi:hypothetical protein